MGQPIADHFIDVNKMVEVGRGSKRSVGDVMFTRYGLIFIARSSTSSHILLMFPFNSSHILFQFIPTFPPILVLFISSSSSVVAQSNTGQQLNNNWTTSEQQLEEPLRCLWGGYEMDLSCL